MESVRIGPIFKGVGAGAFGALLMSALMLTLRGLGFPTFNLEMTLGNIITGHIDEGTWFLGLMLHLINGSIFGAIYGEIFLKTQKAGHSRGMTFGFVHWVIAGLVLVHFSSMQTIFFEAPQGTLPYVTYFASFKGLGFLVSHLIFGAVVGRSCLKTSQKATVLRDEEVTLSLRKAS